MLFRELGAPGTQLLEQRSCALAHLDRSRRRARSPCRALCAVAPQRDFPFAAQHGPRLFGQAQPAMLGSDHDETRRRDLAENRLPCLRIDIGALAEDLQLVMPQPFDLLGLLAYQHIDDVHHAEPLAGAIDGRHRLDHGVGGVPCVGGIETVVAIPAIAGMLFAEPGEDRLAPARRRLADAEQGIELRAFNAFHLVGRSPLIDHAPALNDVAHRIAHPCGSGVAIATSAAGLLVVRLHRARHVEVRHEAHVRLVDAHAERDRRGHHDALLLEEDILVARPRRRIHPGMIRQGAHALRVQPRRRLLHLAAREAVDDAALVLAPGQEIEQLLLPLLPLHDGVGDVRPVEARRENLRIVQAKPFDDVFARGRVRRRCQRDARHAGKVGRDRRQFAILRAEVVAPLADAMRLVDREQADVRILQHVLEARRHKPFGGNVEQLQAIVV